MANIYWHPKHPRLFMTGNTGIVTTALTLAFGELPIELGKKDIYTLLDLAGTIDYEDNDPFEELIHHIANHGVITISTA